MSPFKLPPAYILFIPQLNQNIEVVNTYNFFLCSNWSFVYQTND